MADERSNLLNNFLNLLVFICRMIQSFKTTFITAIGLDLNRARNLFGKSVSFARLLLSGKNIVEASNSPVLGSSDVGI